MGTAKPANKEGAEIAGRCRRIGWEVQLGSSGEPYDYKILPPKPHAPIYIHKTPSSARWKTYLMTELRRAGFDEAEIEADEREKAEKAAKLAADQEANNRATKAAAKRAKEAAALAAAAGPYGGPQPLDMKWFATPTDLPQTKTVIISPEQAKLILGTMNTHNRPLSPARVEYLVGCIKRGEWGVTHQGIAVDINAVLQDGQHRLAAIVESGESVAIQASVGMPEENFLKVDTGKNRSGRDVAAIRGETDPGLAQTVTKMLLNIDRFGPDAHVKARSNPISNDMVDRGLTTFGEELHQCIHLAKNIRKQIKRTNIAAIATAAYLIRMRLPEGDPRVEHFFLDFEYGEHIDRSDPVSLLRKLLFNAGTGRNGYDAWEQCALTIKAWNHRAKGKTSLQVLVWRKANEVFPHQVFLPPPVDAEQGELVAA